MTDFDTSAVGAFRDMKDALKVASKDTPDGEQERAEIKDAVIGLVAVIIFIVLLCIYFKYFVDLLLI